MPDSAGRVGKHAAPDRNDEYLFYQTLLGAWPLEPLDDEAFAGFRDRIRAYMSKAAHEAKRHTSWLTPNPAYDQALDRYVSGVLDRAGNREFLDDFLAFRAACQPPWPDQFTGPDAAQVSFSWSARHVPGNRSLGSQPG